MLEVSQRKIPNRYYIDYLKKGENVRPTGTPRKIWLEPLIVGALNSVFNELLGSTGTFALPSSQLVHLLLRRSFRCQASPMV